MEKNYEIWNKTLVELNNFSCKVEFLQSKMRNVVISKKRMDKVKYFEFLEKLLKEHKHNLNSLTDENSEGYLIELVPMNASKLITNSTKYYRQKQC